MAVLALAHQHYAIVRDTLLDSVQQPAAHRTGLGKTRGALCAMLVPELVAFQYRVVDFAHIEFSLGSHLK